MDQDELRRKAEQAMKRRIDANPGREQPSRASAQQGQRKTLAERMQDLERRLAESQQYRPPVEQFPAQPPPEPLPEEIRLDPDAYETGRDRNPRDQSQRPQEPEQLFELRPKRRRSAPQQVGPARGQNHRASIRKTLDDPAAFRRAFIIAEVLGPPVTLRDENTSDM